MKTNNTLLFLLILLSQIVLGQSVGVKKIQGKIIAESTAVEGINIVNDSSGRATIADENGMFSISAKKGDRLIFSGVNFEHCQITISEGDFAKDFISVKLEQKNIQLEEVEVYKHSNINAKSLGIVPENQKTYSQAERKLKTAGDFKPIMLLGILGGSMPLDPLINKINGRTKRLKKELVVEGKNFNLKKLDFYFDDDYYTVKLKMPLEYINGFKFYIIENDTFVSKLKNNDEPMINFLIIELARKYNEIIACENE